MGELADRNPGVCTCGHEPGWHPRFEQCNVPEGCECSRFRPAHRTNAEAARYALLGDWVSTGRGQEQRRQSRPQEALVFATLAVADSIRDLIAALDQGDSP